MKYLRMVVNNDEGKGTERSSCPSDLEAKLPDLKKDLFILRMQHATNQLDNPVQNRCCQEGYCPHQDHYS